MLATITQYEFILAILMIVVGIPVISASILFYHKQKNQLKQSKGNDLDKEETEMLNDLHKGLERMEKRIQALESIIMEKRL